MGSLTDSAGRQLDQVVINDRITRDMLVLIKEPAGDTLSFSTAYFRTNPI